MRKRSRTEIQTEGNVMNREEIKTILPHREPMLLIDEAVNNGDGTATVKATFRPSGFYMCIR